MIGGCGAGYLDVDRLQEAKDVCGPLSRKRSIKKRFREEQKI